jgi:hypothetical protein
LKIYYYVVVVVVVGRHGFKTKPTKQLKEPIDSFEFVLMNKHM